MKDGPDYCMWFTILILGVGILFTIDSIWCSYLNAKYGRSDKPDEGEDDA